MKEYDKIPAQAVVEVTTRWGRTCLREIGRHLYFPSIARHCK